MKHLTRNIIAMVMLVCLCFSSVLPVYAAEVDKPRNEPASADERPLSSSVWIEDRIEEIETIEVDGKTIVTKVPNFYQNYYYYSYIPYSQGTLGTSGCGITCISMVATYVLDNPEITPDILAMDYGTRPGSNIDRMQWAAEDWGIPYEKTWNWSTVIESLQEGKVVIVLVNPNTKFTTIGHFIVLTGISEDGRVFVNDPNYYNYSRFLGDFQNGFDQNDITCGFSGAWIFEKTTD